MANAKFKRGQRVTLTAYGREVFPGLRSFTGSVVGFSRDGRIRVLRDLCAKPDRWAPSFWLLDNTPPPQAEAPGHRALGEEELDG